MNPEETAKRYRTDFGRLVHRVPRVVVLAEREDQAVHALTLARERGLPLAIRGAGHSCHGQTLTTGVALVNVPGRADRPRLLEHDHVEVSARSRWREVEAFLTARGRSVPVLADYLDLSVGGTLSVGGYGAESVALGAQVDHVERLRLILPDGRGLWCSADEHSEPFAYAMAGLGCVGVIERVVVRTVPYRPWTTLFTYHHRDLDALVDSIGWLADAAGPPMLFKALHARGRFVTTYGTHTPAMREAMAAMHQPPRPNPRPNHRWVTPRYRQWRDATVRLWLARFAGHGRLWADYIFDVDGLARFVRFLQPLLDRDAFAGCLRSVYVVAIRRRPRAVRFPLEASDGGVRSMSFGIGLYSMIPRRDPRLAERVAGTAAECLEQCVEIGGRPYRYGWHQMHERHHRALYGPAYDRLLTLSRELDPAGTLRPPVASR